MNSPLQPIINTIARLRHRGVWNGKRLDPFTGKSIFSRSKHNEVLAAVNALLSQRVVRSNRDLVTIHDTGTILEINGQASGTGGGSGTITQITSTDGSVSITDPTGPVADLSVAGLVVQELTFSAFGYGGSNDYITAGGLQVRLPPLLRFSVASRTVYGVTVSYSAYNAGTQSRTASNTFTTITQFITPQYVSGDKIYAVQVGGVWQDLNVDGRVFAGT